MKSLIQYIKEASMGSLMAAGKIQKDKEESNRRAKEGSKEVKSKQQADLKKSQERDAAWWKAQEDAHKAGKTHFEFDGKTHPLKGS